MAQRPRGELRIIGGHWRSRRVRFADDVVRPTPDRVRQTTFDWLAPRLRGARVLDICAGSGAMGLEALSRGAAEACFVERDRRAAAAIEAALKLLAPAVPARVTQADATRFLTQPSPGSAYDIAFVDPPYAGDLWAQLLTPLSGWLAADHRIFIEWPRAKCPDFGGGLHWHRESTASQVSFGLASIDAGATQAASGDSACKP